MECFRQLKIIRKANKLSQQQLADILGISRSTYCSYETGRRSPDVDTIVRLAEFYRIPLNDFLLTIQDKEVAENNSYDNPDDVRFLSQLNRKEIELICKYRVMSEEEKAELKDTYEKCGCQVLFVSARRKEGLAELKEVLHGKTTTVAGPSGVGKSSLINELQGGTVMETGSISEKIERGKHTTRHSELLFLGEGTYIMDTPGFSSLSLFDMEKEDLSECYPEFTEYVENCRFRGCAHISEPVCGVKQALEAGKISKIRYENYTLLYEELKNKKKW